MLPMQTTDIFGTIIWFLLFFIFIFLYPRLMLSQLIWSLEQSARKLEEMSVTANRIIKNKINKKSLDVEKKINKFTEFFVISPSSLDPFGVVKKIDQTIRQMEDRFEDFVSKIAKNKTKNEQQYINYGLRAAMGVKQIAKMVRHYVEIAKKFKNLQVAMILKMQLPIIEDIAKSEFRGVKAFLEGVPVGDSIGSLVAASFITKARPIAKDIVLGETRIKGRRVFVLKATGPTPHLGRIDEAIQKILRKHRIRRVITIDAAVKLEGEKTGTVAEGVGFAMGGIGQREIIENILLPKKIPIDSIVVKVGITEAIAPMKKEIFNSISEVAEFIERSVERAPKKGNVMLIGVGNSCGVGDDKKTIEGVKKVIIKKFKNNTKNHF